MPDTSLGAFCRVAVATLAATCCACAQSPGATTSAAVDAGFDAPECPATQDSCGNECVDLQTNAANCGQCGKSCPAGALCLGGTCGSNAGVCAAGSVDATCLTDAGFACVDTSHDSQNCGACGVSCVFPSRCVAGACSCLFGLTNCPLPAAEGTTASTQCVDLATDTSYCGSCTTHCASGEVCGGGTCSTPLVVFVSSALYLADAIGGLAGADAKCQGLAKAAGLEGTFKAWLSDSTTDAASRFTTKTRAYTLADKTTVVAGGWTQLTSGYLSHEIDMRETAVKTPLPTGSFGEYDVWTNTAIDGTRASSIPLCGDWSKNTPGTLNFTFGDATSKNTYWTQNTAEGSGVSCDTGASLYCIED